MHDEFTPSIKPVSVRELEEKGVTIGKLDGKKAVVYKEGDKIKACSAICTHKYCIVEYDDINNNLYCPCHGARFELTGEVINGPAEEPLAIIEVELKDGELKLK